MLVRYWCDVKYCFVLSGLKISFFFWRHNIVFCILYFVSSGANIYCRIKIIWLCLFKSLFWDGYFVYCTCFCLSVCLSACLFLSPSLSPSHLNFSLSPLSPSTYSPLYHKVLCLCIPDVWLLYRFIYNFLFGARGGSSEEGEEEVGKEKKEEKGKEAEQDGKRGRTKSRWNGSRTEEDVGKGEEEVFRPCTICIRITP